MGEISQRTAIRFTAGLKRFGRDQDRGYDAAGKQENTHNQRRAHQELTGIANAPHRVGLRIVGIAAHQWHNGHARLEPRQTQRQLGKEQKRNADHRQWIAMGRKECRAPVTQHKGMGDHFIDANADHNQV